MLSDLIYFHRSDADPHMVDMTPAETNLYNRILAELRLAAVYRHVIATQASMGQTVGTEMLESFVILQARLMANHRILVMEPIQVRMYIQSGYV